MVNEVGCCEFLGSEENQINNRGLKVLILIKFLDKINGWKGFFNVKQIVGDNIVFDEDFATKTNNYYIRYFPQSWFLGV
eukprot:snap_masked-scaffold_12-processed-gene-7.42-mRNA-1 protein AED:1.00 eAED:1.00 QI:0/0/0/0/1/1/3/0/78